MRQLLFVLVGLFSLTPALRAADLEAAAQTKLEVTVVNADRVYLPTNLTTGQVVFRIKPAVVDSRQIFDATPEYQEIKRQRLDPNSAEAAILKQRASDRFKSAIRRASSSGGYDLIAETGAITVKGAQPTDVTQEVINLLQ